MVAQYTVFGRQVGSHVASLPHEAFKRSLQLAIATLGVTFTGSYIAMNSGEKKPKEQKPLVNASSQEEEAFIQEFIRNANAEEQKAKH